MRLKNGVLGHFIKKKFAYQGRLGYITLMGASMNNTVQKNHTGIQFFKYSLCGGTAFLVDMITFFLFAWLFFPALTEKDHLVRLFSMEVEPIPDLVRTVNFCINSVFAFITSNFAAYILNVRYVFKGGKHSLWKEVGLFYLVSAISVGIGVALGAVLIGGFGLSTTYSYVAKAVSTTLINFVARKYIIFHG
jgi:putative flippase GtrA